MSKKNKQSKQSRTPEGTALTQPKSGTNSVSRPGQNRGPAAPQGAV